MSVSSAVHTTVFVVHLLFQVDGFWGFEEFCQVIDGILETKNNQDWSNGSQTTCQQSTCQRHAHGIVADLDGSGVESDALVAAAVHRVRLEGGVQQRRGAASRL